MKNKVVLAHLALLSLNLIYAANHLLAKGVTPNHLGPNGFIMFRMVTASILFVLIFSLFVREKVDRKDLPRLAITGVFGIGLSQLLFFNGLSLTSAMNVGILMTSIPLFTVILSYFLLKEKITKLKGLGVLIGGIGAVALTTVGSEPEFDSSYGDLLIIGNAFIFASYIVIVKPLMAKYNPLTVITYNFIFGLIFILLYPPVWKEALAVDFQSFTIDIWLKFGFVIVFATFITYLFNIFSLRHLSPSVTGSYVYTQPAFVILLTFVFAYIGWTRDFGGAVSWVKIGFMLMIFAGVFLISKSSLIEKKKKAKLEKAKVERSEL